MTKYSIERRMKGLESYRPVKPPNNKWIQHRFENTCELLHTTHCCSFYSITLRLVPVAGRSISDEWTLFRELIPMVGNVLEKEYLLAGVVIGIEMSRKDPRRASKLAGRPHMHIWIAVYNDFLNPSKFSVGRLFDTIGLIDIQINELPTRHIGKDVVRALAYPMKDGKDQYVQEAAKHYLNSTSVHAYINISLQDNPLLDLIEDMRVRDYNITVHEMGTKTPSVRRYATGPVGSKLQMAEFIRAICLKEGLSFLKDDLWSIQSPSRYTWTKHMPVSQFGLLLGSLDLPVSYLIKFNEGASWALKEGSDKHLGETVSVFPKLVFMPNLYEYSDGLYDMNLGKFTNDYRPFISANKYIPCDFNSMVYPRNLLLFMSKLVKDVRDLDRLLVSLGGLFHSLTNRKLEPALWVHGKNSTYKSWFVKNFLYENFADVLIHTLDRHSSRFRFSSLRDVTYGVVWMDDFRSFDYIDNAGEYLNLLDGEKVMLDKKYASAKQVRYEGNWALTSNESVNESVWSPQDSKSLALRFTSVEFRKKFTDVSEDSLNNLICEFQPLGLLANYYFINSRYGRKCMLPDGWPIG